MGGPESIGTAARSVQPGRLVCPANRIGPETGDIAAGVALDGGRFPPFLGNQQGQPAVGNRLGPNPRPAATANQQAVDAVLQVGAAVAGIVDLAPAVDGNRLPPCRTEVEVDGRLANLVVAGVCPQRVITALLVTAAFGIRLGVAE